jgi:hypothetical protein
MPAVAAMASAASELILECMIDAAFPDDAGGLDPYYRMQIYTKRQDWARHRLVCNVGLRRNRTHRPAPPGIEESPRRHGGHEEIFLCRT